MLHKERNMNSALIFDCMLPSLPCLHGHSHTDSCTFLFSTAFSIVLCLYDKCHSQSVEEYKTTVTRQRAEKTGI